MISSSIDLSPKLDQRGRSSVNFIGLLGQTSNRLRESFPGIMADAGLAEDDLADDLDQRAAQLDPIMAGNAAFQTQQLLGEYHARNHGLIAAEAFERIAHTLPLELDGPCQLHLDANFQPPEYWEGVDFHRTAGGWDRDVHTGYIHAEIVHRKMVEKIFSGGIFKMRKLTAEKAPAEQYGKILDMGCSTGHFAQALADTYPDAEITGVELSQRGLEHCARVANARGEAWKLHQRPAEDTGLESGSFDLVASYILLHEAPAAIVQEIFNEAFRVLKPGGDLVMADVTRFADMGKLAVWQQDLIARMGGEPFWRETASLDFAEVAREAGFENVTADGIFPHIVQGTKPLGETN